MGAAEVRTFDSTSSRTTRGTAFRAPPRGRSADLRCHWLSSPHPCPLSLPWAQCRSGWGRGSFVEEGTFEPGLDGLEAATGAERKRGWQRWWARWIPRPRLRGEGRNPSGCAVWSPGAPPPQRASGLGSFRPAGLRWWLGSQRWWQGPEGLRGFRGPQPQAGGLPPSSLGLSVPSPWALLTPFSVGSLQCGCDCATGQAWAWRQKPRRRPPPQDRGAPRGMRCSVSSRRGQHTPLPPVCLLFLSLHVDVPGKPRKRPPTGCLKTAVPSPGPEDRGLRSRRLRAALPPKPPRRVLARLVRPLVAPGTSWLVLRTPGLRLHRRMVVSAVRTLPLASGPRG